jgi:hypothetical protein
MKTWIISLHILVGPAAFGAEGEPRAVSPSASSTTNITAHGPSPSEPSETSSTSRPLARIADLGGMPTCKSYADQAPVPDATKARLRKAITLTRKWQDSYNTDWAMFDAYDVRCRKYVANPTQGDEAQQIGAEGLNLAKRADELGRLARDLAPTVSRRNEKPKKTPNGLLEMKKTVNAEGETFTKQKDQNRATLAQKCAATLEHHAVSIADFTEKLDRRAKSLCKP